MQPGIYPDISNDDYHAGAGISKTGLWTIHEKSPAHYAYAPRKEETYFTFGEAGHIAVLEPETFEKRVIRGPDDRRGNKWKDMQAYAEMEKKLLLTASDYDAMLIIRDTIHANPRLNQIIQSQQSKIEHSTYWIDDETKVLCRKRDDLYRPDLAMILDVKTSASAHPDAFTRSVVNYGYHAQEAFYTDGGIASGQPVEAFAFLVVEKTDPFLFALYELPPAIVDEGRAIMRKSLSVYAECEKTGVWPGYPDDVQELSFQRWAYRLTDAPQEEAA